MKVPIMLLSDHAIKALGKRFRALGRMIIKTMPNVGKKISRMQSELDPQEYAVGSFFSSLLYGLIFFLLALALLFSKTGNANPLQSSIAIGLVFWMMFFALHMVYPSIIVNKIAAKESKDLLFALREIMINVDGGVPLFDSMKNVSQSDYGIISEDFDTVVRMIAIGAPEREALKELAIKTESEYLKRAAWQIVNALESGASLNTALSSIVQAVENYIYRDIKNYSTNLNFLMLIYMLVAVVVPSLGITFLVLLSAFSGLGVTLETIAMLITGSAIIQLILIGYMSTTRPEVFGG